MTTRVLKFENVKADTPCSNCGYPFAEHTYVKDSIDRYTCPVPKSETGYGFFSGGDPRQFRPDYEECSKEEIDRWKSACMEADRLDSARHLPCPSGWIRTPEFTAHILRAPFGIGTYTVEFDSEFEAFEDDCPGQRLLLDIE